MTPAQRRGRALLLGAAAILLVAGVMSALRGGRVAAPPPATTAAGAQGGAIFAYDAGRASDYTARATAGNAHALFAKSPGGALATAARVAAFRPMIDRATAGTGIDPALLEGLVFVESAGRPQVIAGSDPADAAGLTQILAETGQSLLGMHINLARSRALTGQITAVASGTLSPPDYPSHHQIRILRRQHHALQHALGQYDQGLLVIEIKDAFPATAPRCRLGLGCHPSFVFRNWEVEMEACAPTRLAVDADGCVMILQNSSHH